MYPSGDAAATTEGLARTLLFASFFRVTVNTNTKIKYKQSSFATIDANIITKKNTNNIIYSIAYFDTELFVSQRGLTKVDTHFPLCLDPELLKENSLCMCI